MSPLLNEERARDRRARGRPEKFRLGALRVILLRLEERFSEPFVTSDEDFAEESSALAFDAVKYLGAAYLIYLGARRLTQEESRPSEPLAERNPSRLFYQGIVVNLLNPKTALFFLAFLPQFVDPSRGAVGKQVLFLGFLFVVMAACTDTLWAIAGGSVGTLVKRSSRLRRAERYFGGTVFIGLGLMTALTRSNLKRC